MILWAYWQRNLAIDEHADQTIAFMERIAKAGYTGLAMVENRFHRWNQFTPKQLENYRRVRERARELKLDFIAAMLPMGYANDILSNDPNLAEGMPVVDAPFVVRGGKLVPDDPTTIVNGSFEKHKDNVPAGWTVDMPGQVCFIDAEATYEGKPSLRMQDPAKGNEYAHARAWQAVDVKPWQYYYASVAVKTQDLESPGDVRLMAFGTTGEHAGRWLNIPYAYAKRTQDWTRVGYTFNTRDYTKMSLYIGSWSGGNGKMWWADVRMEPAGLVNLLRRDGAPFRATTADGKTLLVEGKDLPEMRDGGTGRSPYVGGYHWHAQPDIVIPLTSRLKEGDRALLSYSHTMLMCYNDQVPICMSEPKTNELIDWCVAKTEENVHSDGYFLQHDEIRMQGYDASCLKTGKTCGEILADNMRFCTGAIRKRNPNAVIYVWSDMFDPHHNAQEKGEYELVRGDGPWFNSWKGLDAKVGLVNWNAGKPESLKFFSDLGKAQIISAPNAATLARCFAHA